MTRNYFYLFSILSTVLIVNAKLPFSVETCSKDSDDYSSCLKILFQDIWSKILPGVPELNIPKLQPYQVESGIYTFEISEITAKINVENVILHGLEKLVFQSVKPKHGNDYFSLDFVFTISDVFVEGDYKASGALGSYRHSGQGKFNVTVQDMEAMVHLVGPVDTNDIWSIEEFHFKPEFGNMKFWASNIFKGNKDLTEAMLNLINSYWRNFVDGMMPLAEKNWNKSLAKITNDGLKNIKFSDIFP